MSGPYIADKRQSLFLYVVVLLCMIFLAGLRRDNADWPTYKDMFVSIMDNKDDGSADLGFNFLCKIISFFFSEIFIYFLLIALISVSLNAISFYRYTPYIFTALLLYFCHNFCLKEMIQIRAGLASAICLFSLYYLHNKRPKVFFTLFVVAVSVHLTSAIFLVAYISWRYLTKKKLLYCILVSLFIGSFFPVGSLLKNALGIDDRLDEYIAYGDDGYGESLGVWTNINTLKCLIIFCFLYANYDRLYKSNKYFDILFKCYVPGLCWLICFNDFSIIGARVSNILLSSEPILLTYPYYLFKKSSRIIYSLGLVVFSLIILILNMGPSKITPYLFYFSR